MGVQCRAVWESFEKEGRSKHSLGKGEWRGWKVREVSQAGDADTHIWGHSGHFMSYALCPHLTEEQTELWEVKMLARHPTANGPWGLSSLQYTLCLSKKRVGNTTRDPVAKTKWSHRCLCQKIH